MQQSKCVTNEKRFKNNRQKKHRLLVGFKSLATTKKIRCFQTRAQMLAQRKNATHRFRE